MIVDLADSCLYIYVIVDDLSQQMKPLLQRSGSIPHCSDSERMARCLVGECKGWDIETEMFSNMEAYPHLFPHLPSQSRLNRWCRTLIFVINMIRRLLLAQLDLAQDKEYVIDSLPIAVVHFHLAPSSTADGPVHQADFAKAPTKHQTIYGYKLHMLVTMNSLILDFMPAPSSATDLEVGFELLTEQTVLIVVGDKAYISAQKAAELQLYNRIRLYSLPQRSQNAQLPTPINRLFSSVRQIIETVNGQLTEQFNIESSHAHSFWRLCARLYTKLAAYTLYIDINRLLPKPDFFQFKALTFPY